MGDGIMLNRSDFPLQSQSLITGARQVRLDIGGNRFAGREIGNHSINMIVVGSRFVLLLVGDRYLAIIYSGLVQGEGFGLLSFPLLFVFNKAREVPGPLLIPNQFQGGTVQLQTFDLYLVM